MSTVAGLVRQFPVNLYSAVGTVMANEKIEDNVSVRGGHPLERTPMRQQVLGITEYADRPISRPFSETGK